MTWVLDALCRTRPADWWETGDGGNRLALALCSVCPVRDRCSETAREPHGVIRAGVAYRDSGEVAEVCPCGRPLPVHRDRADCFVCVPRHDIPVPAARRRRRDCTAGPYLETVGRMLAQRVPVVHIAERLGVPRGTVQTWIRRYRLRAQVVEAA